MSREILTTDEMGELRKLCDDCSNPPTEGVGTIVTRTARLLPKVLATLDCLSDIIHDNDQALESWQDCQARADMQARTGKK